MEVNPPKKETMQINLKQSEIITALKQYITHQGISLVGKTVDISFTAGRKEAGLSAEISIEDSGLPEFVSSETTETSTDVVVLKVVHADPVADEEIAAVEEPAAEAQPEPLTIKTTSLFGN